ncbi:MAG: hypothetical protein A3K14_04570 [Sulfurimonas sp. RIFCSPLOWO2_12_FULL_36_74]|uniref:hypothetical protein n=1 Tax=Sulfurimonas sp. RIFCSPLOWO2_12_36_12 TaxID=1802253 RepID=UPI0008B41B93|nr:hypothetical protein [Sulfurimonas sp. RIFCSPLOWO2_12_36_12]OHE00866.1 MAG: hypothetical protein A3J26_02255 [Sulfurimonas sp. RIFCSPLOWO2_02_FULL_36_28]OHE01999.1 MAG: hypothetical protein A2W82_04715 [Sulfurimonas sp. RIFCSPLOWO2_12_36_12]OHE06893.1 MAG: hypothetical protein A3K14_04570 [Sulfurimonas sp. RIFCSPLOWO2_12_FULL_36_74]
MKNKSKISAAASLLLLSSSHLYSASINGLGDLTGGIFKSEAYAISADGSVVVGYSRSADGDEAFRWTEAGMIGLGDLAGGIFKSEAFSANADGSVVVGYSRSTDGDEAFRWTEAGMVGLGSLAGGSYSYAFDVSADGSVIVGHGDSAMGDEAFRWTQADNMLGLGYLAGGGSYSYASSVSADGSVVVGYGDSANGDEAFRWTQADEMVGIGDLAGGTFYSAAYAVSADGSVVVGESHSENGYEAFRWTEAGMIGLGDLAGGAFNSYAVGVNADGSVVVGDGTTGSGREAFRWTQATGMQSLNEWLAEDGYTLTGWSGLGATGVSDDGNVVVGYGSSSNGLEAFIARGGSGLIGLTTLINSIASVSNMTTQGINLAQTALHGAHGHPGANRAIDDKYYMWLAGDYIRDKRYDSKDDFYLAEIGVGYSYNQDIKYSIAYGRTSGESDLLYNGKSEADGYYVAIDTDIKFLTQIPLYATLTYLYGKNDFDIKRGYENAGNLDASYAGTDQKIEAFRARLQWHAKEDLFHPYVEYNHIKLKTDGYTEISGGFPAQFDAYKESVTDYRYGIDSNFQLNEDNRLITTLEGVHRTDKEANGISGELIGLQSFQINGEKYKRDWMRATLGIESTFDIGRFTLTLNASTKGADPQFWSGFNYTVAF